MNRLPLPRGIGTLTGLSCLMILTPSGFAQTAVPADSPVLEIGSANWTATDALGRKLPGYDTVGDPKPNRHVGLFYWQWHGDNRWGPDYNVTEFLKTHPGFMDWQAFPPGGPNHPTWYWAEPLFGYYRSTDPWVIRKHLVMFADAGVDFLFLDYTNGSVYDKELVVLVQVAQELKANGVAVPKLTFFLNHEPDWKAEALYKNWYKPGKYDDLWFRWQGKPLILSPQPIDPAKIKDAALLPEVRNYFTWRPTWAFQDSKKDPNKWRFMDRHPQHPALGPDGKIEQMVVSKSLGGPIWKNMETGSVSAVPGKIPVYSDQFVSPDAPKGLFFEEQWRVALQTPAPILLVTGWNEWTASVWETPGVVMLGRKTVKGQGHIVDEFNTDFNRDLEPMKGGYGDNYYWQFVADLRRYKGMRRPEAVSAPKTISITGDFAAWNTVRPLFRDAKRDIANRDANGTVPNSHYTDSSARNDIVLAQAARDKRNVYFHVQTAAPLSPATDKNWMVLFIDADANPATGWHGYDFVVNRSRGGSNRCTLERNIGGRWQWQKVASVPIRWAGKDLNIALPRRLLGESVGKPLTLDFKWADNLPDSPSVDDFYLKGDVAPNARFSYRYEEPAIGQ